MSNGELGMGRLCDLARLNDKKRAQGKAHDQAVRALGRQLARVG
jgi:hypothetical protein